jgi:Flp pilus assembly pilin Flp
MQLSLDSQELALAEVQIPLTPPSRKRRRGATSMEYCVMASFILLVLIASVHALGIKVGGLFTSNAAATSKFSQTPNPGP